MAHFSEEFTQKYALSKTLRFELKPVGKTYEQMMTDDVLVKDENIEKAYQTLKPVMDKIHDRFITESLESEWAKAIDFSEYIQSYTTEKTGGESIDQKKITDHLRGQFGLCFDTTAILWKENIGKDERWKEILKEKGYKILTESGILEFIKQNVHILADEHAPKEKILNAIGLFEKFFTYFTGFNQNRENYYTTKDQKSTAVATRIIHENLPKFCDNILVFTKRKKKYLGIYDALDKTKQIKDATTNKMVEIYPITEDYFYGFHFSKCLSQREIGEYNRVMGHYNSLINLYNQQQTEKSGKLSGFKTLYKQIGCGSKKSLFFQITHDFARDTESKKQNLPEAISVEEILREADQAGERYFTKNKELNNVQTFLKNIEGRTDWVGYYWSKAGFNTISSWYFADWQTLAEKFKKSKENPQGIWEKTDKNKEMETGEKVKIPDAISLAKIFAILNETPDWRKGFFRERILEKRDWTNENEKIDIEKQRIFEEAKTPSEVIIHFLCFDIKREILAWESEKSMVLALTEYHSEESKALIKSWMDHTVNIFRMIKYFSVPEGKIKDEPMNAELSEMLKGILFEPKFGNGDDINWYQWYDGLRNYLTKKVGEEEKENKVKLNFESGSLLGGWSDGQEKIKKAVLLRDGRKYYLWVLKKNNLFDTTKEDNPLYSGETTWAWRLILANLKFQTLAGKWFLWEFWESYGNMGKRDPLMAIQSLQKIISDRYAKKYPLLKKFVTKNFTDKQLFDKEIQETLIDCYVCEFTPIKWNEVEQNVNQGNLYLFEIYTKDLVKDSFVGKDLQTIYWETLFDENSPFQLNGGAEIFYRKPAIKDGDQTIKEWYENKPYIINKKRFTKEKFLFHCPIKINYKSKSYSDPKFAIPEINGYTNDYIVNSIKSLTFLGIDRGEKHLAYYSLVDETGTILKQGSFNEINGQNYHDKLEKIAENRDEARKNWKTIGTIKEMKEGYISQVVHEIVKLATEHNALIILEDLNTGFKRGRQKIEKSIYQKFELALAKKLNFVVDKSKQAGEIGSVTHALQFTPPVANYGDIENRKQIGIMLYTRANYTSQTDPLTGWRRSMYLKYDSKNSLQFLEKFASIERKNGTYIFTTQPDEKTGKIWKLTSWVNRYVGGKNMHGDWEQLSFEASKILDEIFANISWDSLLEQITENNLVKPITLKKIFEKKTVIEGLVFTINTIMQIRNSGPKKKDAQWNTLLNRDDDFLHSPVLDENTRKQYDSREYWNIIDGKETVANNVQLPVSGDANGAYNIARKGILMVEHIRNNPDSKDINLFISETEWDLWLTDRKEWTKQLPVFVSRKKMEEVDKYKSKKSPQ